MSTRDCFEKMAKQFAERTERIPGVVEVGVVGSTATETVEPGDLDLAVFLSDRDALPAVAKAARQLTSLSHKWSVWVFEAPGRRFLGWVGIKKREPLVVNPDFEFDERKFMNVDPRVLWSRADGILVRWRKECLDKAAQVGWSLPQPKTDRRLRCTDCGEQWVWTAHEQRVFQKRDWKPPIRCPGCRPARCALCGRRMAVTTREAEEQNVSCCESCAEAMIQFAAEDGFAEDLDGPLRKTAPLADSELDEFGLL